MSAVIKLCPGRCLILGLTLVICMVAIFVLHGCAPSKPEPQPAAPSDRALAAFEVASKRLLDNHVKDGYVFSIKPDGSADHQGEGVLEAGIAMTALKCGDAAIIADSLADWIIQGNGFLRRFEPMPDEYIGKELNFDEETGLEAGIAGFAPRCPAQAGKITEAWRLHKDAMDAHGGEVFPGGDKMAPFGFTQVAISHALYNGPSPGAGSQTEMEKGAVAWALGVKLSHGAAYRVHLAYRHLRAAEDLGYTISQSSRNEFCANTMGLDIPNVDAWCGRGELGAWIDSFVWNKFEYQFQRAASYEQPDGNGDQTPANDLLEAIRQKYSITN